MKNPSNQKLNVRVRDKKRKLTICLDNDKDFILCTWAKSNNIINHYGMPNRSAAVEKMIEMFIKKKGNSNEKSPDNLRTP